MTGSEVEEMYLDVLREVRANVSIPVAMKLSPYFSATANMAARLCDAGADGLVLFNRFYQPDFDVENLELLSTLQLSTPQELLLRLHWAAILFGNLRADLAITGGVHGVTDIVKCMMAGARAAMTTSALLERGIVYARQLICDLQDWMLQNEYRSIEQMQGAMSAGRVADPSAYERGNYMRVLGSYTLRTPSFR